MMQRFNSYQSSYESFSSNDNDRKIVDDDDDARSITANSSLPPRRATRSSIWWSLTVLAVLSVLVLLTLPQIPTQQEREIAQAYNLPLLGSVGQIRNAQLISNVEYKKVIQEIQKKNGAAGYMEVPEGCDATVLLVRHCEKSDIREHCSYTGYERSVYLASLFGDDDERWPTPSYIFAESPNSRHNQHKLNFREIETVGPLAEKAGVTVDDSYSTDSLNKLSRELLTFIQTGQMCGKVTVVSWKHSDIGHLAHRLGCGPMEGCPIDYRGSTFDDLWQIKFVYRQFRHSNLKNLRLPDKPEWRVFGSVQSEGFDPLALSKKFGDYPRGGTQHGARWQKAEVDVPERKKLTDTRGWKATRVGFEGTDFDSNENNQKESSSP